MMENKRDWSKLIAIALSFIILTQFVQVAFLGAQKIGIGGSADAGADASRGSIAEEAYGAIWNYVGTGDSMIMTAEAAGTALSSSDVTATLYSYQIAGSAAVDNPANSVSLVSMSTNDNLTLVFKVSVPAAFSTGEAAKQNEFLITFPNSLSINNAVTTPEDAEKFTAQKVDNSVKIILTASENNIATFNDISLTVSGITLDEAGLPAEADDPGDASTADSWEPWGNEIKLFLPAAPAGGAEPEPSGANIKIEVEVVDFSANELHVPGASFRVFSGNTLESNKLDSFSANNSGVGEITLSLNDGTYIVKQFGDPISANGMTYTRSNADYEFAVVGGEITTADTTVITVTNAKKNIKFKVVNEGTPNDDPGQTVSANGVSITYGVVLPGQVAFINPAGAEFEMTRDGSNITGSMPTVPNANYSFTMSSLSAGEYTLTQKKEADGHKLVPGEICVEFTVSNNTISKKSISPNGVASWSPTTADTWAEVRFANAISSSEAVGTGTINIHRYVKTTKTGSEPYPNTGADEAYQILLSDKKTPASISDNTGVMGKRSFTDITYGTYYIKDVEADSKFTYAKSSGAGVTETESGSHIWGPIELSSTNPTQDINLYVNRVHNLKVVDQNGDALDGEKVKLEPAVGSSFVSVSANEKEWTLGKNGKVDLSEYLADSGHYTLSVPTISGSGNLTVDIAVKANGEIDSLTPEDPAKITAARDTDNTNNFTVTRIDTQARVTLDLMDDDEDAKIEYLTGAAYKLYSVSGGNYNELESLTVADGFVTSTHKYENGVYAIAEDGANKAPAGYLPKNSGTTTTYYQFEINNGVRNTLASGSASVWPVGKKELKLYYNRKPTELIVKRGDAASITAGTEIKYKLTYDDGGTEKKVGGTDVASTATGTDLPSISFNGIEWGTEYTLTETSTEGTTNKNYELDANSPYKTYKVHPDPSKRSYAAGSSVAYDESADKIVYTVTITPVKAATVRFTLQSQKVGSKASANIPGTVTVSGTFKGGSTTPVTLTFSGNGAEQTLNTLIAGQTYTLKYTSSTVSISSNNIHTMSQEYQIKVNDNGTVSAVSPTDTSLLNVVSETGKDPLVQLFAPISDVKLRMEICTAEQGYSNVDEDQEVTHAKGFTFAFFTDTNASTAVTGAFNESGTAASTAVTDKDGYVHLYGLADGTYYVKCTTYSAVSDAGKVKLESASAFSIFKMTVGSGTITALEKSNSNGTWKAKNKNVRAYLQTGAIKLTANSDKTFYLYRLCDKTDGTSTYDGREDKKLTGSISDFSGSTSGYTKVVKAEDILNAIKNLFVLHAYAADKMTLNGNTWALLDSKTPGKGYSVTFENLISGQRYLIREGESGDTDKKYYLADVTNSTKELASVASSNASTAKSGASTTTAGSGTQSNGTGAGGRGAATGDDSRLWFHLIVMLIAFDALAADLLYITRRKKKVRK